jgi:hypothetical protein
MIKRDAFSKSHLSQSYLSTGLIAATMVLALCLLTEYILTEHVYQATDFPDTLSQDAFSQHAFSKSPEPQNVHLRNIRYNQGTRAELNASEALVHNIDSAKETMNLAGQVKTLQSIRMHNVLRHIQAAEIKGSETEHSLHTSIQSPILSEPNKEALLIKQWEAQFVSSKRIQ